MFKNFKTISHDDSGIVCTNFLIYSCPRKTTDIPFLRSLKLLPLPASTNLLLLLVTLGLTFTIIPSVKLNKQDQEDEGVYC